MSLSRVILSRTARLLPMGLQSRIKWTLMIPDQLASLRHMRDAGFNPKAVVDVGAYVGKFAKMAKDVWPDAGVIMFEPQPDKQAGLEQIARSYRDLELRNALLLKLR